MYGALGMQRCKVNEHENEKRPMQNEKQKWKIKMKWEMNESAKWETENEMLNGTLQIGN